MNQFHSELLPPEPTLIRLITIELVSGGHVLRAACAMDRHKFHVLSVKFTTGLDVELIGDLKPQELESIANQSRLAWLKSEDGRPMCDTRDF